MPQIINDNSRISLADLYQKEKFIAQRLLELTRVKPREIEQFETRDLEKDQIEALDIMKNNNVFILCGAPGTGKTFLIKRIIDTFAGSLELAAPTGRAAKRMSELTNCSAYTIHTLLEPMREPNGKFCFQKNEENLLDCENIIIDETSMVPIGLMYSLLSALKPNTRTIFVGDHYQLPAIGPGSILKDMLLSGAIASYELNIIKRQEANLIVNNCHRIKDGRNIEIDNSKDSDFFFVERSSPQEIKETIIELITDRLPKAFSADIKRDIQLICPHRTKTELSGNAFNEALQLHINTNKKIEGTKFRISDKVINNKNQYELDITNGDLGEIKSVDMEEKAIYVNFFYPDRQVQLPLYDNNLDLAYAVSVHKYQGSEAKIIIMPIHSSASSFLMTRNLLYTGISRAKDVCILVGQREEIPKIIARNKEQRRYTNLNRFLQNKEEQ